jgi:hypothetical protein
LYRYSAVGHESAKTKIQAVVNALEVNKRRVAAVGLNKLNSVEPELESTRLQPLNL